MNSSFHKISKSKEKKLICLLFDLTLFCFAPEAFCFGDDVYFKVTLHHRLGGQVEGGKGNSPYFLAEKHFELLLLLGDDKHCRQLHKKESC